MNNTVTLNKAAWNDLRKVRSDSAEVMEVIHKSKWRSERISRARAYLAVTSFMIYNQAMKLSFALIMFFLLSFW